MGDVFYIHLRSFSDDPSVDSTIAAIEEAIVKGTRKFIVDLRSNYGGNSLIGNRILEAMGVTAPSHGGTRRISRLANNSEDEMAMFGMTLEGNMGEIYTFTPAPHLAKNPNNVFASVLTDRYTYSSSTMFGVWAQDGKFGNIVGEPSSNSPSAFGDMLRLALPSGIILHISYTRFLRPDADADQSTLVPDIPVDADKALDAALEYLQDLDLQR